MEPEGEEGAAEGVRKVVSLEEDGPDGGATVVFRQAGEASSTAALPPPRSGRGVDRTRKVRPWALRTRAWSSRRVRIRSSIT